MPKHKLRTNGFSPPYTRDQFAGAANVVAYSAAFYVMCIFVPDTDALWKCVGVHVGVFGINLALWIAAELIDPATEGCGGMPCFKHTESRYDREMGKKIPGLDHHCKWLNTAIGRRNYGIFFGLISMLFVQYLLQFAVGVGILIVYAKDDLPVWGSVLVAIHELWGACNCWFTLNLVLFHVELMYKGITSYDWMLAAAKAKRQKRKQNRAKKMEEGAEAGTIALTDDGSDAPPAAASQALREDEAAGVLPEPDAL